MLKVLFANFNCLSFTTQKHYLCFQHEVHAQAAVGEKNIKRLAIYLVLLIV